MNQHHQSTSGEGLAGESSANDADPPETGVDAGEFGAWLDAVRASFRGGAGVDVPCGDCRGCCTSSQFILLRPEDEQVRTLVPRDLLVEAPGRPGGHEILGFTSDGLCPLLKARECSVYADRPRTCRDYDCRLFAAAGIEAGGEDRREINERVRAWRFRYTTDAARRAHGAIRSAAAFIPRHRAYFPGGRVPTAPGELAALAVKVHEVFLQADVSSLGPEAIAGRLVEASRAFERGAEDRQPRENV
jgi:Fe-S-cluster containining protein